MAASPWEIAVGEVVGAAARAADASPPSVDAGGAAFPHAASRIRSGNNGRARMSNL